MIVPPITLPIPTSKYEVDLNNELTKVVNNLRNALAFIVLNSKTPTATADTTGKLGDIVFDDDYIYVKTSAGWKHAALTTF